MRGIKIFTIFFLTLFIFTLSSQSMTRADSPDSRMQYVLDRSVVMYVNSPNAYVYGQKVTMGGEKEKILPYTAGKQVMIPVYFTVKSIGADAVWSPDKNGLTITTPVGMKLALQEGQKSLRIGTRVYPLHWPVKKLGNELYIQADILAKACGKEAFLKNGLIVFSDRKGSSWVLADTSVAASLTAMVGSLPSIDTLEQLKTVLQSTWEQQNSMYTRRNGTEAVAEASAPQPPVSDNKADSGSSPAGTGDYSTTNVQVAGVDEADMVKTDGKYIYQVNLQRVIVARAYPAEELEIVASITFDDPAFQPLEMYLQDGRLTVLGNAYENTAPVPMEGRVEVEPAVDAAVVDSKIAPDMMHPYYGVNTLKVYIYDVSDVTKIQKVREVEMEGQYVSSRRIGNMLYLVANKYMDYYAAQKDPANTIPRYGDSAAGGEMKAVDLTKIYYFPGMLETNYMTIASLHLEKQDTPLNVSSYLGAGQNIYVSAENLYVAAAGFRPVEVQEAAADKDEGNFAAKPSPDYQYTVYDSFTSIFKFSLRDGNAAYVAKGEVPGNIINQFSMDEAEGYFRIATTNGEIWRSDEYTSKNNIYTLDAMMNVQGKLEGIAPGERIYSVRFMGKKAYMVTFRTVDPLFVVDMSSPTQPRILGQLKIPGYSEYLHPYDENHIIGFGKDTIEKEWKDDRGNAVNTMAYYLGLKMAIFDVTDVTHPKEMFTEYIGDRGTDSEILRNHKALLFSRDKNLLALPALVMKVDGNKTMDDGMPVYGRFDHQGAYVYRIDLEKGFQRKGIITHMTQEDTLKAGDYWYDAGSYVNRILYIGDTLYTLSNSVIKANRMSDLAEIRTAWINSK